MLDYSFYDKEDLIDKIKDLNNQIWNLENDTIDIGKDLWDEMKLEIFMKYKDNFTPFELEKIFADNV